MSKIMETAKMTEQKIHDLLDGKFDLPKASMYSVKVGKSNEVQVVKRADNGDVYDLLSDEYSLSVAKDSEYIAVLTCGWAAPVTSDDDDNEMPPSQHPQRRRVRLVIVANPKGVASILRFSDDRDNIVTDEGNARGSLADAVQEMFTR